MKPQTILRRKAVQAKTGLSTSVLYDKIAKGEFPRPLRLSAKAVGWLESEIDDWITARIAERDGAAPEASA